MELNAAITRVFTDAESNATEDTLETVRAAIVLGASCTVNVIESKDEDGDSDRTITVRVWGDSA